MLESFFAFAIPSPFFANPVDLYVNYLTIYKNKQPKNKVFTTFSRSDKLELMAQNFIMFSLLATAAILWWLSYSDGELWGSNYLPKPLSVLCVIVAIAARLNIKGQNISFGANPHNIGKDSEQE